jgi:hypothetical protein
MCCLPTLTLGWVKTTASRRSEGTRFVHPQALFRFPKARPRLRHSAAAPCTKAGCFQHSVPDTRHCPLHPAKLAFPSQTEGGATGRAEKGLPNASQAIMSVNDRRLDTISRFQ